jgi:hypothetical protein
MDSNRNGCVRVRNHSKEWEKRKEAEYRKACDLRALMREALGGKCLKCGLEFSLSFHHPKGRDWEPRRMNLLQRMRHYYKDFLAGLIELWCVDCNQTDGSRRAAFYLAKKRA